MTSLTPFEQLKLDFDALKRQIEALENRVELLDSKREVPLLPAYLSLLASDYERLVSVAQRLGCNPRCPRHKPRIILELRRRGWSTMRIARIMDLGRRHVQRVLRKARLKQERKWKT